MPQYGGSRRDVFEGRAESRVTAWILVKSGLRHEESPLTTFTPTSLY